MLNKHREDPPSCGFNELGVRGGVIIYVIIYT